MNKGNDDLLFGQPNDLEEAVDTLIAFYSEDRLKKMVRGGGDIYQSKSLYGIALFIRNNWFLWWHPNHNNNWFPVSKPPLLHFFHNAGVTHPDDMTSIIFSAIWHRLTGKPYDMAATIQNLHNYWKEQGYADGKPDTNTL